MSRRKFKSMYRQLVGRVVDMFEITEYEGRVDSLAS